MYLKSVYTQLTNTQYCVFVFLVQLAADEVNKPEVGEAQEEEESADKTTPDITIAQLSSATGQWTTKNTQSVGELWIGLLKLVNWCM